MFLLKKVFEFREKTHKEHEKPFLEHLEDLRILIFRVVLTLVISTVLCFLFQEKLMTVLRAPAEKVLIEKQRADLPVASEFEDIRIPTAEQWSRAKIINFNSYGLSEQIREKYLSTIRDRDLIFYAEAVAMFRVVQDLEEDKRAAFIDSLKVSQEMRKLLRALRTTEPSLDPHAGLDIRMMSALKPTETFMLSMKISFFAGIIVAFPLLIFFILQFVLPGLYQKEKRYLWPAMVIGFGLFLLGIFFAYYLVLPKALGFFQSWSDRLGVANDWRIGEYITFATQFTLLFGLSFELPVLVMLFVKLGILHYEMMSRTRAYAVVGIVILAAVVTPTPDIATMLLMALPMILLYEICIWLAWFDRKKRQEKEEEEAADLLQYHRRKMIAATDSEYDDSEEVEEVGDNGYSEKDYDGNQPEHAEDFYDEYSDTRYYDEVEADSGLDKGQVGRPEDEDWMDPQVDEKNEKD